MTAAASAHVRIIDRPCGSGKTSKLLKSFAPDHRYIVVVNLLSEVDRVLSDACVPFIAPLANADYGTKRSDLENLLLRKQNIVTTHQLYADVAILARRGLLKGYDIIVDEVPNVCAQVGELSGQSLSEFYVSCGYATVAEDGQVAPTPKWDADYELVADTLSLNNYQLASAGMLYAVDDTALVWAFPRELLEAGRSFTVLTYLAGGAMLVPYLERLGIPYVHDWEPEADQAFRRQARQLLDVRAIPTLAKTRLSYSAQQGLKLKERGVVAAALRSIRRGDLQDVDLNDVVITCSKGNWFKKGRRGLKPEAGPFATNTKMFKGVHWLPNTTRGTNDYAHASHAIYLYDQFINPKIASFLGVNGSDFQSRYAVTELIQWVYRTRIRRGETVVLYLPSARMRRLLQEWLVDDQELETTIAKERSLPIAA
ncbi:hypothetical protein [Devosia sp. Leaf64]|uniref:hypothetical protein n=1 Tax=Devosia sp. Leaf64 TaxID=1736229 RepID=UPI0007147FC5|nr:hypothetical protein [Devosia sp. Leaf64]KQN73585.1 hypothetical protein ASE94_04815 [Devosia sp. Leaf64]